MDFGTVILMEVGDVIYYIDLDNFITFTGALLLQGIVLIRAILAPSS